MHNGIQMAHIYSEQIYTAHVFFLQTNMYTSTGLLAHGNYCKYKLLYTH